MSLFHSIPCSSLLIFKHWSLRTLLTKHTYATHCLYNWTSRKQFTKNNESSANDALHYHCHQLKKQEYKCKDEW